MRNGDALAPSAEEARRQAGEGSVPREFATKESATGVPDVNGNLCAQMRPCRVDIEQLDLEAVESQGVRLGSLNRSESTRSFSSCISLM